MDIHNKDNTDKGSIFSEKPEPIFENVVAQKYPKEYEQMKAEEVPSEITSDDQVDKPVADVLQYIPSTAHESKYRIFFIVAVIGFFLIILFVLFNVIKGGGKGSTIVPSGPVTLIYWGLWEDESVLKPVFDKYREKNPNVTIKYEKRDPKDYLNWLNTRITNKGEPDIFRFHNTWLPQLSTYNIIAPVPTEIISNADYEKTFHKIHQMDMKIGNRYYGIPLYVDGLVLLYNPSLLKSAGVATVPTLLAGDFIDAAQKATAPGENGPTTAGVALGSSKNVNHFSDIFGMIFLLNVLDDQSKLDNTWAKNAIKTVSTDQSVMARGGEALQIYREFEESKYWGENMPTSVDAFAQGKVAMIFAPTWEIPIIMAKNSNLDFAVAKVPEGLSGRKVTIANYWAEGVSSRSKNQVEAWKLLKFMSEPSSLELLFKTQTQQRGMGMAYSRIDMKQKLVDNPKLAPLIAELDYMVSIPFISYTFDGSMNDENIEYIRKAIDSAASGVSYSAAFSDAATGIAQVLLKYKIE